MPDQSVVTISFNLVSGAPQWSAAPMTDEIPWGTTTNILWQLVPGTGAPWAEFPSAGGVVFTPNPTYPTPWPNAQPTAVPAPGQPVRQYQALDPNYDSHSQPITYKYTVTVTANGQTYSWDPEVENDSGS
jgi:hypothetical protein